MQPSYLQADTIEELQLSWSGCNRGAAATTDAIQEYSSLTTQD